MKKSIDANWPSGGVHFDFLAVGVSRDLLLWCQIGLLCHGKML